MELLTRSDALSIGAKYYFTGKPCGNGHIAPRYASIGNCLECQKNSYQARRAKGCYDRERQLVTVVCPDCDATRRVRPEVPNKAKREGTVLRCRSCARKHEHVVNKAAYDKPNEGRFVANLNSPQHIALAAGKDRYMGKPCKIGHSGERYAKDTKCVECVAIRAKERTGRWAKNNPGKRNATAAKRRAIKALATPAWLTDKNWEEMELFYIEAAELTEATGVRHEVDHIIPLQGKTVCGFHCPENLRVITMSENRRKNNKLTKYADAV